MCSGGLVVEVVIAILLKLGLSPSRNGEADVGRNWWCLNRPECGPWCTAPARGVPSKQHLAVDLGCPGTIEEMGRPHRLDL